MTRGRCERGATAVEYALLVAVCVLAMAAGLEAFGNGLDALFVDTQADVDTWDD